jgi:acyl carrier protein
MFELELGADSRDLLEIMAICEETFDIEIDYNDITSILTVQNALDYIKQRMSERDELYNNLI